MTIGNLSSNFFISFPALGKPNPLEPKNLEGPDLRSRVRQNGSKEPTLYHAVLNLLREQRYKASNISIEFPFRHFEKLVSKRRKNLTNYNDSLPFIVDVLFIPSVRSILSKITTTNCYEPSILQMIQHLDQKEQDNDPSAKTIEAILPHFKAQMQYNSLFDYLKNLRISKRLEINLNFLSEIGVNPSHLYQEFYYKDPKFYRQIFPADQWETLTIPFKTSVIDSLIFLYLAKKYNLEISSWLPNQPIDDLLKELKKRGPLAILGRFGKRYYIDPPQQLGQIQNRNTYGWLKTSKKNDINDNTYIILLIGAEQKPSYQIVYYLDPQEASDPKHPEEQRVYAMSYQTLTSPDRLCDLHNFLRLNSSKTIGYALGRKDVPGLVQE